LPSLAHEIRLAANGKNLLMPAAFDHKETEPGLANGPRNVVGVGEHGNSLRIEFVDVGEINRNESPTAWTALPPNPFRGL
jgi:hypothetical protein